MCCAGQRWEVPTWKESGGRRGRFGPGQGSRMRKGPEAGKTQGVFFSDKPEVAENSEKSDKHEYEDGVN